MLAIGATLAVLTLAGTFAGLGSGLLGWHPGAAPAAEAPGGTSLPSRIGVPGLRTPDELRDPLPAASVLISGNTWFADGSRWYGGLIGAGPAGRRVFANEAGAAGLGAVLSPDGRRLASGDGILDIATGRWSPYPRPWREREVAAQAWSPDGRRLAVTSRSAEEEPPYPGSSNGTAAVLSLLRVDTGAVTEVADLDDGATLDGWTAAFSPDGGRLAYQARDRIRIFTIDGHATTEITPAPGSRLAGKGSWSRDGRHLLLVAGRRCPSCGDYPVRWTVTTVSAATGAVQGPQYRLDGVYAVRVLGWWPSGRPVAAAYTPVGDAAVTLFDDSRGAEKLVSLDDLDTVRLLELGSGPDHRELSRIDSETVDVADDVLMAGRTGPAQVPAFTVDNVLLGLGAIAGTGAAMALLAATRLLWGRWRCRRPAPVRLRRGCRCR